MSVNKRRMMEIAERLQYRHALTKIIYAQALQPFCDQEKITAMEMDILVFITAHPEENTATGYCESRKVAKSNVSTSIRALEEKGYLVRYRENGNKKTIYLLLTDKGKKTGEQASECIIQQFVHLGDGISEEEFQQFMNIYSKIERNMTLLAENIKDNG